MNLTEATIKALQGKLIEGFKFYADNRCLPFLKDDETRLNKYLEKIASVNKPIKYSYIAGYSNFTAIYDTKEISIDDVRELFLKSGEGYFVTETDDCVMINRVD